jgi:2-oxoglutarate ferredoxin oxidoreductase subunit alpha
MLKQDVTIRIGGEGGEGVISAGDMLAELLANSYFHVLTHRTYPAEIKGGLAMIQVRVSARPLSSQGTEADVLFAFNDEAVDAYRDVVKNDGYLFYDPALAPQGEAFTGKAFAVPLNQIAKEASGTMRGKNVVAVGVISALLGLNQERISALVAKKFAKKGEKIVENNRLCLEAGWKFADENLPKLALPEAVATGDSRVMMNGNTAFSYGVIAGNARFIAGYPITPATSVLETLSTQLPRFGGKAMQCEDEIAALAACLGASFGGVPSVTATSGPGMCLMSELLGLAAMTELPVVVIDVQRGGPSTGLPTKQEQSDLNFAVYGTPGDVGKIVLAPTSVEDCYYTGIDAAKAAEVYQTPVIVLSDTTLAVRTQTFTTPDTSKVEVAKPLLANPEDLGDGWRRYEDTPSGISPRSIPGMPGGMHTVTGLEHDETGHAKYTGPNHEKMTLKRARKMETFLKAFDRPVEVSKPAGAKLGVIGWGSTFGTIQEALAMGAADGLNVAHCQLRLVSPLPVEQIRQFVAGLDKVIVVEENFSGQLAGIIRSQMGLDVGSYAKALCGPIAPEALLSHLKEVR